MKTEIEITKDDFEKFEAVRDSGVCNMWDSRTIQEITDLSREQISKIRSDYGKLSKEFGK